MCVNPSREQTFPPAKSHHFPRYHFLCSSPLKGTGTRVPASHHTVPVPTRFIPMCVNPSREQTFPPAESHHFPRYHFLCSSPLMGTGTRVLASHHTVPVPTRFIPMCGNPSREQTFPPAESHHFPWYRFLRSAPHMGTGMRVLASQHTLPVPMCSVYLTPQNAGGGCRGAAAVRIPNQTPDRADRPDRPRNG